MENEAKKKMFILGDSILKGVTFDQDANGGKGKYRICGHGEFDALADRGLTVVNRSRMGATLAYADGNIAKLVLPDEKADCLLIEYGGNDCDYDWKAVSDNPDGMYEPKTKPELFGQIYRRFICSLRSKHGNVAVTNLPPIDADKMFAHISIGLCADNILRWLGDVGMLYRWQEYYNTIVEKTAEECGVRCIDIRSCFLRSRNYRDLISGDGIHPTEEGHRLIRAEIVKAIV